MKNDKNTTAITDEYLKSLDGLTPVSPPNFFYERLVGRLSEEQETQSWLFPFKPIWMIGALVILLTVNAVILTTKKSRPNSSAATIESFAAAYDQNISSY